MKRYWLIVSGLITLTLIGCSWQQDTDQNVPPPPVTIKPLKPPISESETDTETAPPPEVEKVPPLPKMRVFNWAASIEPLVDNMLNVNNVVAGSVLLLDSVKNSTNGQLQSAKATEALYQKLVSNKKFVLISANQLAAAKKKLGLSENDSLGSRTKAIGLARSVGAQYVLYSDIKGNVKAPTIDIQLMLVETGEILWSGEGVIGH
ncbi:penicillin-binding protein activator LpoB [Candidatus Regiella insecticola]|uniref:Penicillin-binding protein activator LpoB n=1 Tax=Candidatus Regiella insecticola TaxID=138073 RepID=A0A6L2ZQ21_9ENTR|nr:penicillin-binding protein activator LpoB [Candidatus Regiella insecticola]GFN46967.1 penicillin-binding protein activator LpoB [Candidatus Regiella insecticola]